MAIKIPSKNIYEIDNPKVKDNLINEVRVEKKNASLETNNDVIVSNIEINNTTLFSDIDTLEKEGNENKPSLLTKKYWRIYIKTTHIKDYEFKIKKLDKNSLISSIYLGEGVEKRPLVTYSVTFQQITKNARVLFVDGLDTPIYSVGNIIEDFISTDTLPSPKVSVSSDSVLDDDITYSLEDKTNLSSKNILIKEDDDFFYFKITALCGLVLGKWDYLSVNTLITDRSSYVEYIPQRVNITFRGILLEFSIADGTVTYGGGNKPHSLTANELLQDSGVIHILEEKIEIRVGDVDIYEESFSQMEMFSNYEFRVGDKITYNNETVEIVGEYGYDVDYNKYMYYIFVPTNGEFYSKLGQTILVDGLLTVPITEYLANNVLKQYAVGKETATLLCDINEYYDENGDLVISTEKSGLPMTFNIGNEVIPYVFGANGQDKPMSLYRDGNPKVFRIIGTNTIYDGAVWQELTLQEVTKG